jgi:beta-fructofuranosidase
VSEARPVQQYSASGWAGLMSLPRILTLDSYGRLTMRTVQEVSLLRQTPQRLVGSSDEAQNQRQIASMRLRDCCGEILCTARLEATAFEFAIGGADVIQQQSWLSVSYDPANPDHVMIDGKVIPVRRSPKNELELHLYIDGSVIELFVNQQIGFTKRFYYSGSSAPPAGLRVTGKTALITDLSIWQLSPISSNRLTT